MHDRVISADHHVDLAGLPKDTRVKWTNTSKSSAGQPWRSSML